MSSGGSLEVIGLQVDGSSEERCTAALKCKWTARWERVNSGSGCEWTALWERINSGPEVVGSSEERRDRDWLFGREAWPRLGLEEWPTPFNKYNWSGYLETV